MRGTAQGAARAAGVGVGGRGGAPASRARVDRLRTLATLVRVGGRVHEHAVLWMLAIRERRLARWRSRLVAAAHTSSMRGSAERERERERERCVCSPLRSGVRAEHFGPCRHGYPRTGSVSCARRRRQQRTLRQVPQKSLAGCVSACSAGAVGSFSNKLSGRQERLQMILYPGSTTTTTCWVSS